jgi:uncharacterized protein YndB with AHSA1/START domain
METKARTAITVEVLIKAPVENVWKFWSEPNHIAKWCSASDDWHVPKAENDLKINGKFNTTMAARDGSMSFDFEGVYTNIQQFKLIEYTILDGRKVTIRFSDNGNETNVTEIFEAEDTNPVEMQRGGWQAILDNFKKYVEAN